MESSRGRVDSSLPGSDERWNSRIRALKELMNNHLPAMEKKAPPEALPASPPARAARSPTMVRDPLAPSPLDRVDCQREGSKCEPFDEMSRGKIDTIQFTNLEMRGMSVNPKFSPTFDSTSIWDVEDDGEEEVVPVWDEYKDVEDGVNKGVQQHADEEQVH